MIKGGLTLFRLSLWYRKIQRWTLSRRNNKHFKVMPTQQQRWVRLAAHMELRRAVGKASWKTFNKISFVPCTGRCNSPQMFSVDYPRLAGSCTSHIVRMYASSNSYLTIGMPASDNLSFTNTETHCQFRRYRDAARRLYAPRTVSLWTLRIATNGPLPMTAMLKKRWPSSYKQKQNIQSNTNSLGTNSPVWHPSSTSALPGKAWDPVAATAKLVRRTSSLVQCRFCDASLSVSVGRWEIIWVDGESETGTCAPALSPERKSAGARENVPDPDGKAVACKGKGITTEVSG